jgi:hypothetical protein
VGGLCFSDASGYTGVVGRAYLAIAGRWFGHALGLFRQFGDGYNEADTLLNLGDVFAAKG